MRFSSHISITAGALRRWFVAQCLDSVAVAALWWIGLEFLHVPWAPFWAIFGGILQFVPQFGTLLGALGPLMVALFAGGFDLFLYVLILYGCIVVLDGLLLQPLIMRRSARVPIWASLTVPILLSMLFGFWGILLAAPLLAVIFAYRSYARQQRAPQVPRQTPPGQIITGGQLIIPETYSVQTPRPDSAD
jgi:predicted PurR-regulated permease PerM